MQIAGARILVTGANGFIGGALVERLTRDGASVRALVRRQTREFPSSVEICHGDVTEVESVARAVEGCDAVVHAAARHITRGARDEFDAVNVRGTENLLRAFAETSPTRARFVLVSTINVLGIPPPRDAHADSPLRYSGDPYSDSKIDGEKIARQIARAEKIPLTIVRPACVYGPRGEAWTLLPLRRLRAGRAVLLGRGDGICNAVFIDDVVEVLARALVGDDAVGEAFIASAGAGVTWREFYGAYARLLGGVPVRSLPYPLAHSVAVLSEFAARLIPRVPLVPRANVEFYTHRVVFDIDKTRRVLGYEPRVSFVEGMARTEAWLRATRQIENVTQ